MTRADASAGPDSAPPISCYIRTLNEEARIARTVEAAKRVAAEVVVVDSGSTDSTAALAAAAGARVVEQPWLGSGRQKRAGEDQCRHEWLLDLDADERVGAALAGEIRGLFAGGEPDADVYALRLVTVDPAGRVWRKSRAPHRAKLYDRRKIRMPAHGAWDQLEIPPGPRVRRLKGFLYHHAFSNVGHLSLKQVNAMIRRRPHLRGRPRLSNALRVYCGFPVYFFIRYVLRGMWREGSYGLMAAMATAYGHWCRDALLFEAQLRRRGDRPDADGNPR